MYNTEAEFSKALCDKMRRDGRIDYTRIESHGTANGIPDLYVMAGFNQYWVELKNSKSASVNSLKTTIKVPWRPGQQAWFEQYRRHNICRYGVTLMSAADCVFIIPMDRIYENNTVYFPWFIKYGLFDKLRLSIILDAAGIGMGNIYKTYREAFLNFMDIVIGSYKLGAYDFDPDVAWENSFDWAT